MIDSRPVWFVGSMWYGQTQDHTERFLNECCWEIREPSQNEKETVKSILPGDRIFIKSTCVRKNELPFANEGQSISTMKIKAEGTVKENSGDGCTLKVTWTPVVPFREWYFFTYRRTIWKVHPTICKLSWAADELIRFAIDGKEQDYARFWDYWYPNQYLGR